MPGARRRGARTRGAQTDTWEEAFRRVEDGKADATFHDEPMAQVRALEAAIVTLVAERATAADLAALRSQLQQEHTAVHRFDQPAWARLASGFHLQLAELAGNPILQRYLVETVSRCSLIVALHEPPGNAACEHDEHERIVECIARRDVAGAVALMDTHLRDLEHHLSLEGAPQARGLAHLLGMA